MSILKKVSAALLLLVLVCSFSSPSSYAQSEKVYLTENGTLIVVDPSLVSDDENGSATKGNQTGGVLKASVIRNGNTTQCGLQYRWTSSSIMINKLAWDKITIMSTDGKTTYKTFSKGTKSFNSSYAVTVPFKTLFNVPKKVAKVRVKATNIKFYMMYGGPRTGYGPANNLDQTVTIN